MTPTERSIRFNIALEQVERIYNDYCHDDNVTRDKAYEFCCVVREMIQFAETLKNEAK